MTYVRAEEGFVGRVPCSLLGLHFSLLPDRVRKRRRSQENHLISTHTGADPIIYSHSFPALVEKVSLQSVTAHGQVVWATILQGKQQ